jgi:hypothetical protein
MATERALAEFGHGRRSADGDQILKLAFKNGVDGFFLIVDNFDSIGRLSTAAR